MSELAAQHMAHVAGFESAPELLRVACEPVVMFRANDQTVPLEYHTIRNRGNLGFMPAMLGYIGTHAESVLPPLNETVPRPNPTSWDAPSLAYAFKNKSFQDKLALQFLGKTVRTGKLLDVTLETLALDEMPEQAITTVGRLDATHSTREYFTDNGMYYALRGFAKLGRIESELAVGFSINPFLGSDPKMYLGAQFAALVHDFPQTRMRPEQMLATKKVTRRDYRFNYVDAGTKRSHTIL